MTNDLERFFEYLVSKTRSQIFILLDGLDESDEDHGALSNKVLALSQMPKLKICCSSRADEPFKTSFASSERLKLEDLNSSAIREFADKKAEKHCSGTVNLEYRLSSRGRLPVGLPHDCGPL